MRLVKRNFYCSNNFLLLHLNSDSIEDDNIKSLGHGPCLVKRRKLFTLCKIQSRWWKAWGAKYQIKDTFRQLSEVKTTQGLLHDYLGMTLDHSVLGQVSINMTHYVEKMVKEFPKKISREHQFPHHGMKTSLRYNMTVSL